MNIFSIYDSKAECYNTPFFSRNAATATRDFQRSIEQEGHPFHNNAEDFTLFQIGYFDEDAGTITPNIPVAIAQAHTLVPQKPSGNGDARQMEIV